jgi:hypothetical protein
MKPRTTWEPRHTEILRRMAAVGYTDGEIGAITGHCRETVRRQRADRGISVCKRIDWMIRSGRDMVVRESRRQPCALLQSA